jgi:endonuclease/exonuclease/phosphatase (EEP) superfamily protein YafD
MAIIEQATESPASSATGSTILLGDFNTWTGMERVRHE